jgi:hypothetical protein
MCNNDLDLIDEMEEKADIVIKALGINFRPDMEVVVREAIEEGYSDAIDCLRENIDVCCKVERV